MITCSIYSDFDVTIVIILLRNCNCVNVRVLKTDKKAVIFKLLSVFHDVLCVMNL